MISRRAATRGYHLAGKSYGYVPSDGAFVTAVDLGYTNDMGTADKAAHTANPSW